MSNSIKGQKALEPPSPQKSLTTKPSSTLPRASLQTALGYELSRSSRREDGSASGSNSSHRCPLLVANGPERIVPRVRRQWVSVHPHKKWWWGLRGVQRVGVPSPSRCGQKCPRSTGRITRAPDGSNRCGATSLG